MLFLQPRAYAADSVPASLFLGPGFLGSSKYNSLVHFQTHWQSSSNSPSFSSDVVSKPHFFFAPFFPAAGIIPPSTARDHSSHHTSNPAAPLSLNVLPSPHHPGCVVYTTSLNIDFFNTTFPLITCIKNKNANLCEQLLSLQYQSSS